MINKKIIEGLLSFLLRSSALKSYSDFHVNSLVIRNCFLYFLLRVSIHCSVSEKASLLPALTATQLRKLQHLTIVSLAAKSKVHTIKPVLSGTVLSGHTTLSSRL